VKKAVDKEHKKKQGWYGLGTPLRVKETKGLSPTKKRQFPGALEETDKGRKSQKENISAVEKLGGKKRFWVKPKREELARGEKRPKQLGGNSMRGGGTGATNQTHKQDDAKRRQNIPCENRTRRKNGGRTKKKKKKRDSVGKKRKKGSRGNRSRRQKTMDWSKKKEKEGGKLGGCFGARHETQRQGGGGFKKRQARKVWSRGKEKTPLGLPGKEEGIENKSYTGGVNVRGGGLAADQTRGKNIQTNVGGGVLE